jgi:signal peptidase II
MIEKKYVIWFLSTLSIVFLDQLSKFYIEKYVLLNGPVEVVGGLLDLTYVRNAGAAFGLLSRASLPFKSYFFISISILALIGILYFLKKLREEEIGLTLGLSLIFGGALGNLIDRVSIGVVIDFLDFHVGSFHWPAFNIADTAITIGAFLLVLKLIRRGGQF